MKRRRVRFMVVGMGAVALHGGVIVTDDVDLWVEKLGNKPFQDAVKAVGGVYIPPTGLRPPTVAGRGLNGIDLVTHMSGLGKFEEEYRNARLIKMGRIKVPVLALERIIASKRAANRPKDKATLPVLKDLLKTLRTAFKPKEK